MANIQVVITGDDKENVNVEYVILGDKRWGNNGQKYDVTQIVENGTQDCKVKISGNVTEENVEVGADDTTLTITINANDIECSLT